MTKVAVAMSGGVDSTVTAYLLMEKGYEVVGITMKTGVENVCEKARKVADELGIKHYVLDVEKEFKEKVIDGFVNEYSCGNTPNPCVVCNRCLKFGSLWECAKELGCDYMATGHYANVYEENGKYAIKKGDFLPKDQSYFMFYLKEDVLKHLILPLGIYKKEEIRKIAEEHGISVAQTKDSQDICFIPDGDYRKFIMAHGVKENEGDFVDLQGRVLGKHKGLPFYTIGQRKGLGIALGYPAYVVDLKVDTNQVVLGVAEDLVSREFKVKDVNYSFGYKEFNNTPAQVKIRYKSPQVPCYLTTLENGEILVKFESEQSAVTRGQAAVFYENDLVIGGGIIL